ncbi:zinc finger protein 234-like [Culex quinquefasciatus]|uniref:zinc finger protein 234-like n=1 Tax=Culex quinquefasciatus TaxID=7176 RepID=UPI0018E31B9E|nr:zinc finger protein 234-like [Culex quinquefasciatus]
MESAAMDSVIKVIPSDNPAKYCRLCFADKNLVALFPGHSGPEHLLVEQISLLIGIQIGPAKDGCSSICWRCAVALEDFQLLRQRSLDHDAIIRNNRKANAFEIIAIKNEPVESEVLLVDPAAVQLELSESSERVSTRASSNGKSIETPDKAKAKRKDSNDKIQIVICKVCNAEFGTTSAMRIHLKEQHTVQGRPFHCPLCPSQFKRKGHLERHMESHTGKRKFACKECGASFSKATVLARHRIHHHQHPVSSTSKPKKRSISGNFKCAFCPKSFKHRPSLNTHFQSHYDILPFSCELCDARFAVAQGLLVHRGKFHNPAAVEKPDMARFKCEHCPRFFKYRRSLKEHVEVVHLLVYDSDREVSGDERDSESGSDEPPILGGVEYVGEEILPVEIKTEIEDVQFQE